MKWLKKMQNTWLKLMASQLRFPSGMLAKLTGQRMNTSNALLYQLLLENIEMKPGNHLLEIGFGNGKFFSALHQKAQDIKITGIDHSPQMVKAAIKNNQSLYQAGIIKLMVGSSAFMPLDTHHFDAVCCVNVIYFWENPEAHLQEIFRVLKPGGKLYIGIRPQAILANLPFSKFGFHLRAEDEWINIFSQQGFLIRNRYIQQEPPLQMGRKSYPMQGLCLIFEKI